jgi:hypothetical protein
MSALQMLSVISFFLPDFASRAHRRQASAQADRQAGTPQAPAGIVRGGRLAGFECFFGIVNEGKCCERAIFGALVDETG